jgi:D-methionine transport system substrate-binding protein
MRAFLKKTFCIVSLPLVLFSCSPKKPHLKVMATAVPHAEILSFVKEDLKASGIDLEVIVVEDYQIANRALADKEIDANFFQHAPFLEKQVNEFGYPIKILAKIELEPLGIYSEKVKSLKALKTGDTVAIPNDPTNEARALLFLSEQGIIRLKNPENSLATVLDIEENSLNLKFFEVDAAMAPRTLSDVTIAVINTNYALGAGLSPLKDALVLERRDSPYANILVVRAGDESRPDLQLLKNLMTSHKIRKFLIEEYDGAVLPAF